MERVNPTPACECGAPVQDVEHVLLRCPIHVKARNRLFEPPMKVGLEVLAQTVGDALERAACGGSGRELSVRHSEAMREAAEHVEEGHRSWKEGLPLDLLAEQLRQATDALDQIAGRTTPEDQLDRIFSRFCLGK